MKKIIFITVIIIFIPFLIVNFYKIDEKEEIKIKYMSNTIIRVKRMGTGNIDSIPFEEYIVGVLAGEMPIYFDKFKLLKHKQWRREVMLLKEWSIIKIMIMMLLILL